MKTMKKKFNLYKFTEELEKNYGHMKEDDLTDLEKAQIIVINKAYQMDNVFRLYINEMANLFINATKDNDKYIAFIKRSATFIETENIIKKQG